MGRNDPCPCGSGKPFQAVLPEDGPLLTGPIATTTNGEHDGPAHWGRPVLMRHGGPEADCGEWVFGGGRGQFDRFTCPAVGT
ncbi:MAG: SEC-C metal-binding domain-containing protein [Planctomycetota bacterium]